jgi:hypothetical protein
MSFTPKIGGRLVVTGILTIALGFTARISYSAPESAPAAMAQNGGPDIQYLPTNSSSVILALYVTPAGGFQAANSGYYQPVTHWYKSKHWWKRNAPVVGGAAGGALIGGLAGGGTGALIGGAVGGGGGYAYKRLSHRHHHHHYYK